MSNVGVTAFLPPAGSSWTFGGVNCGVDGIAANGSAFNNPNAPNGGTQVALLKQTGSFSQRIYLAAGSYWGLRWLASKRLGKG